MRQYIILLLLFLGLTFKGQTNDSDSIRISQVNYYYGTEEQISIRVGGGLQNSFYLETGIAFHKSVYGDVSFLSHDFYTALEWNLNKDKNIYGVKIGYEINPFLLNLGIEFKYLTDFKENDFVFTPKIGLGIYGDVNIFYGYNLSLNQHPFSEIISKHQLSLIFNLNNHFLQYK